MSLKQAFTQHFSQKRRNLFNCGAIALLAFMVFSAVALLLIQQLREEYQHSVEERTHQYAITYLNELTSVMRGIMPQAQKSCASITPELTYKAAFTSSVRAFLLIKNGVAYCSSATGEMALELREIYPEINWHQPLDMKLQQGTPIVPDKPVAAIWLQQAGSEDSGVLATLDIDLAPYLLFSSHDDRAPGLAIIMGNRALTTFSPQLMPVEQLPQANAHRLSIKHYPLAVVFYNQNLTSNDIRLSLLGSLVLAVLIGVLAYYMFLLHQSPQRALLNGIRHGEFVVEYQPVFACTDRALVGMEALIRWWHPTEGLIPPDVFIPYAESNGLIDPLTRHLFELIIHDLPTLAPVLPENAKMGINLPPSYLVDPAFLQDIQPLLAAMARNHCKPVFEVTERGMVEVDNALAVFNWLQSQGIEIAIDDFGTGHSALIYLERFALDYLKIDRGFINAIGRDSITTPVLDAVIALAKRLDMQTIAEGVETAEQFAFLQEQGVNYMQGYYFSKPLGLHAFTEFAQAWQNGRDL